ncbi:MAG: potassium/proton antiporter [Phycisphaerales bacterium]|nr:potassium/proton antiporter [Phycisphaerales bacterium]MCI0629240.1 potassium/proton antiporter [Phycisphaerales bacterium]MCI0675879.1 potassium/proton antiporter [Phycisphaerales bacterium]
MILAQTVHEPTATAVLTAIFGLLMAVSVLFSRALERLGVPIVLLFLGLGMAAGSQGIGGIEFEDYHFAFRIGTIALALILFDGGLNTTVESIKHGIAPASVLATVGVAGTAGLMAFGAHRWVGLSWQEALLLGAIVSSTDAATVFSVLRGSRLNLQRRVGVTLELESGLNDPLAVILTMAMTESLAPGGQPIGWSIVWLVPMQLLIGASVGISLGWLGVQLLRRLRLQAGGLYAVFTLGLALGAFGLATLIHGSGFLAVYAAAIVMGNSAIPYRSGLTRIHDAIAWLGQITMFLMMGLLVFPLDLVRLPGVIYSLALAIFLATVARPVVVWLCLLPFGYSVREMTYIGWVGLRGAVPIILATIPVMENVPNAIAYFNIVFFVVVINAIMPGASLRWLTRWLKLDVAEPPTPAAVLEINSTQLLRGEIHSFFIDESLAVANVKLAKIPFPQGAAVILMVRDQQLLAARGDTVLLPGDHVYVFCHEEDRPYIELLFGRPQAD